MRSPEQRDVHTRIHATLEMQDAGPRKLAHLSPTARAARFSPIWKGQVAILLVRREGHHAVGIGGGLQRPEALHVGNVEHVEGVLEAHRHALAVELHRQYGREEVHLADGVVFFGVPQTEPTRADVPGKAVRGTGWVWGGRGARVQSSPRMAEGLKAHCTPSKRFAAGLLTI